MTKAESSKAPTKAEPKLQTVTLKAFIHCEGCRRKIRRIIRVLDGVEDVVVESATGKVTVTGSDLDAKSILQRLQKHGKRAELWPSAIPTNKPAGANQQKSPNSNTPSSSDANAKSKQNASIDTGGEKPVPQASSEAKKGGKKEELRGAEQNAGKQEGGGPSESKQAEKNKTEKEKQTSLASEAEARDASSPQGKGGNGGGKKGKKVGNGSSSAVPDLPSPPPPHHVQDIPIASVPVTNTVTVSANRAPSPYDYIHTGYSESNVDYATHMFSDENANNCSLM